MKLTKPKIIILTITGLLIWLAVYSIQPLWWSFENFINPNHYSDVEKIWEGKSLSNSYLLKQLQSRSITYSGVSANILAERKDPDTIEPLMKIIKNSKRDEIRGVAIGILCNFYGKPYVQQFLVDIVKQGRKDSNYLNAIRALSEERNSEIYPEILKMAKDNYETSYVVGMLEHYPEKPETIEALTKIANTDPEKYIREKAKKALKKIKG